MASPLGLKIYEYTCSFSSKAFEDVYLDSRPTLKEVLRVLNIFFAAVFVLEFLLKIIGLGITSYFSSAWNWLDVVIVVVSNLVSLVSEFLSAINGTCGSCLTLNSKISG